MVSYAEAPQAGPLTTREYYVKRWTDLKTQRAPYDGPWREIGEYVQPRRTRFFTWDRQSAGTKKNFNIINSSPTRAVEVNAAGMQAGITSPTRPWFRTTTSDKTLAELDSVKQWLGKVDDEMYRVFAGSNIYLKLHEVYLDLGPFGTSVMHIEEDVEQVIRAYVFPIGSYALAASAKGLVDTVFRALQMRVEQLVDQFGYDNCSQRVRSAYDRKSFDDWVEVLHVMEPNRKRVKGRIGREGMKYRSCWMELSATETDGFLREAGFNECPFVAPRWGTTGEDVYGSCPGMTAIGDCKTLQMLEREALRITEKLADPPMVGPSSMREEPVDLEPGGINYEDPSTTGRGFRPAIELPGNALTAVEGQITRVDARIRKMFMEDLWLMLAQDDSTGQKTATEVIELRTEKMLQLGPMLERFQDEALRPLIERVFAILLRNGMIPPPPVELSGQPLKVEYISILAQAQKMAGIQALQELSRFATGLGESNPDVLDNLDEDAMVTEYADNLGTPPEMLRPKDEVAARRAARQKQAQQMQQMQQAQAAATTAKTASEANTTDDNALTRVLSANGVA